LGAEDGVEPRQTAYETARGTNRTPLTTAMVGIVGLEPTLFFGVNEVP